MMFLAACGQEQEPAPGPAEQAATPEAATEAAATNDNISGVVQGEAGPEAGVWVIAETDSQPTRYAKIVVTDDAGRFLIPDLPAGDYQVWVRGYGLADSAKVAATPGAEITLNAVTAPSATVAAQVYPAAYWYSMMGLPTAEEVQNINGGLNGYLTQIKNMGCVGCHQLGQLSTRTIPAAFNGLDSSHEAWVRRLQSGQAGGNMVGIAAQQLLGLPYKYLSEWTDRIAAGELPRTQPERHRTQCGRDRAGLVRSEGVHARPVGNRPAQSDRKRLWQVIRLARIEHR